MTEGNNMIYTLTLNPAIDCVASCQDFNRGYINSIGEQSFFPSGKGVNVSILLARLGVKNTAMGFLAGFTGVEILSGLQKEGVNTDFVMLKKGCSRVNLKLSTKGEETELNGTGPELVKEDFNKLMDKLKSLENGSTLVLSGSLPASAPKDLYGTILDNLKAKDLKIVLDTADLLPLLHHRPFLVKPNHVELQAMLGHRIHSPADAVRSAKELVRMGAEMVLVSMAEQGAVLQTVSQSLFLPAVSGPTQSPCGAGDSMVAGFLYGLPQGVQEALCWGTAAGAATAFAEGIAQRDAVINLRSRIEDNGFTVPSQN